MLKRSYLTTLAAGIAAILAIFQICVTGGIMILDSVLVRGIHICIILGLIFLWVPYRRMKEGETESQGMLALDILLALLSFGLLLYIIPEADYLASRMQYVDDPETKDIIFGTVGILLVLEGTRRTSGWALVIVASLSLLYAFFGDLLPAAIGHKGVSFARVIEMQFMTTDGMFGIPLATAASIIFVFIMFGVFLEKTSMSSLFMELACLLTKNSRGGPAKVAIFASALFGTISGSAPGNVYATGTFTIPLMKRVGYAPPFAGAVEAVASTGGQIMPPIMGTAAFIMADITGVGYTSIAKAALLPALLYYLALWMMIHLEAIKKNLGVLPREEVPEASSVIRKLYYILPVVFLIFLMMAGKSIMLAAYGAIAAIILLGLFRSETRLTPRRLFDIFQGAARNSLMISTSCASAGIIVGVFLITGAGFKFINLITMIAGSNLLLLMVMLMLTCIILGMGVPTTPAYILVATLGAPALVKAGIPVIAAHLFVFYYAILSVITPPVCIASFAGASIAKAKAMETGFIGSKLGSAAFIIPFFFVLQPALVGIGELSEVVLATVSAIFGTVLFATSMQGYLLTRATMLERALLMLFGLSLLYPGLYSDIFGLCGSAAIIGIQLARRSREKAASTGFNAAEASDLQSRPSGFD